MRLRKWQKALIHLILYYLLLFTGAAIIMYIEAKGLEEQEDNLANSTEVIREILDKDVNIALNESKINEIIKLSYKLHKKAKEMKNRRWKKNISWSTLYKWRYFTHVTITTVGYGDVVPETDGGKTFVIIYSLIGIPMNILLIATIGSLLSGCFIRLIRLVEQSILKVKEVKNIERKAYIFLLLLAVLWLVAGGAISRNTNGWSWTDGFYYAFVKYSTIGYGDLLVSFDENREFGELISWYTTIGLAIITGLFNAVQEEMQTETKADKKGQKPKEQESIEIDSIKNIHADCIDT